MKITHAKFLRRRTHAQYEHSEVEIHAEISDSQSVESQLEKLRESAYFALYGEDITKTPSENVKGQSEPKKEAKKETPKKETLKEEKKSEVKGDVPPVIPEEAKKEAKKETPKKSKNVAYNSSIPSHKTRFTTFLNTEVSDWKLPPEGADEDRKKKYFSDIKDYTGSLNGVDFEDEEANILPEFSKAVKAKIAELKK